MSKSSNKEIGLTQDAGYQIGARKTFAIDCETAWTWLTSSNGLKRWLGTAALEDLEKGTTYRMNNGTRGEVRVCKALSHLRVTWHPGNWLRASLIQVRVIPGNGKTTVAFHQEHLPGPEEREARRQHFKSVLQALEALVDSGKL